MHIVVRIKSAVKMTVEIVRLLIDVSRDLTIVDWSS